MSESLYRVVWPLGRSTAETVAMKPRMDGLSGKTIGQLSHGGFRDQEIRPILEETLNAQFEDIRFIDHTAFGNIHGLNGAEVVAALPGKLRQLGCDAIITGIGS